uniref:Sugar phosphate transporter domain-containing protein n=1 Tax=Pyrodinium bahamense TaxID=73915 RepID=A0A7S0B7D9_9DINO
MEPAQAAGTSLEAALALLGSLALGNFVHAAAFFYLLARIGAVSAGVAKALQAVAVFLLSHVLYCSQDASQCLTPIKSTSLIVVVSGALVYAGATAASATGGSRAAKEHKEP